MLFLSIVWNRITTDEMAKPEHTQTNNQEKKKEKTNANARRKKIEIKPNISEYIKKRATITTTTQTTHWSIIRIYYKNI